MFLVSLVFLCCADLFFAVRIHNYNFRIGQLFLLAALLPLLYKYLAQPLSVIFNSNPNLRILLNWIPFFLIYAITAIISPNQSPTLIKLAWAVFNIGGAALLFLGLQPWGSLKKAVLYGMGAVAFFICLEFIVLYFFGGLSWFNFLETHSPADTPWFRNLLGYAQIAPQYENTQIFRPHAFYYEPSYAGCALTFAFPLSIAICFEKNKQNFRSIVIPALIFCAIIITTSRSAVLGIFIGCSCIFIATLITKRMELFKYFVKIISIGLLFLVLSASFPLVQKYGGFFANILNPHLISERAQDPQSSEGWRVANTSKGIETSEKHPWLGIGVPPLSADRGLNGLGQTNQSMWVEVLIESGTLGFLAFLFGLGKSLYDAVGRKNDLSFVILIFAAIIPHFSVSMNFTSTFPRLDYWLLFFFAVRMALENQKENSK